MTTLDEAVALASRRERARGGVDAARRRHHPGLAGERGSAAASRRPVPKPWRFVTYGRVKLANLRARPQLAVTFRNGWQWATVEGTAELAGPDDPQPWLTDADQLRLLLREVFTAAGGTHDDWDEYDRMMAEQRRTVVLVAPTRVYSNG